MDFAHFGLELGMVFEETTGVGGKYLLFQFQVNKKERWHANSKYLTREVMVEVVDKSIIDSSCVIIPYMTSVFYKAMNNLQREILCWSLFGLTARSPKVWAPLINSTFFHADINQSEVEGSFQLASYYKSVWRNVDKSKVVTLLGSML